MACTACWDGLPYSGGAWGTCVYGTGDPAVVIAALASIMLADHWIVTAACGVGNKSDTGSQASRHSTR